MVGRGLREREPGMLIAQSVLDAVRSRDELLRFRRGGGELGRVAGALTQDSVLMEQGLGDGSVLPVNPFKHSCGDCQGIAARFRIDVLPAALQPFANPADS